MFALLAAQPARQQPPKARAEAGVDAGYPPGAVLMDQLHLAGAHEARGVDVDHAVPEHI
jgi:hypothetical protein